MEHIETMDSALKEALQDSLPENHPGHVPDTYMADTKPNVFREILGRRSRTLIDHMVSRALQDPQSDEDKAVLLKILECHKLDEMYALCYDRLGETDKAVILRDWMAKPKKMFPIELVEDLGGMCAPPVFTAILGNTTTFIQGEPARLQSTAEEWDHASVAAAALDNTDFFVASDPDIIVADPTESWSEPDRQSWESFGEDGIDSPQKHSVGRHLVLSGEVEHNGHAPVHGVLRMQRTLVRLKGRKAVNVYYTASLSGRLSEEDFLIVAEECRKQGWRRGIVQRDQYMGESVELLNFAEFHSQYQTGRPGIYIKDLSSF